ncbi:hypothetical protein AMATHDRAFT_77872 [Amanita thiersii Skay4041]|uniref:Protein ARV n=1 Tax=Amanita thiersii Skay4041 TaxID=703135 RepID=A0A2A9NCG3_9AGAR|nr:hypothetical protein AMATHDRAFT_77872 [Amanita thiersii Skay4041]
MPICTTCTAFVPHIYTVYESAYNLRLEQCTKCNAFADPYVEHDSLTLLLDLILLKRGVYRHLLYNRGSEPRKASSLGKEREKEKQQEGRSEGRRAAGWFDRREKKRWLLVLELGGVLIFLDACQYPNLPPPGSPWTLTILTDFVRVLLGCFAETIAFHGGITLMCYITLAVFGWLPTTNTGSTAMSDIRREFRFSLIPLTLFYSSLTKFFLLFLLTIWRPSTTPIPTPSFDSLSPFHSPLGIGGVPLHLWRGDDYVQRAFVALDDDKLDKEWFIRNILGGMSAGFGLRVILDAHPLLTTCIIIIGWSLKTFVASMLGQWVVGGSETTGLVWLEYSMS